MTEKKATTKKTAAKKTAVKKEAPKKAPAKKTPAKTVAKRSASKPAPSGLPMLYNSIEMLSAEKHGKLKLRSSTDFSFAKSASSVILGASEFAPAAMHYPIVFGSAGDDTVAYAVLGYANQKNVYVDGKGKWRAETYIPAYVRRYPFMLVQSSDASTFSLAADTDSKALSDISGSAIYEKGAPSKTAKSALEFCMRYRQELIASTPLLNQINESGVLIERTAEVTTPDGKKAKITGFKIVDEGKLRELDDKTFLALRKTGALNLIYCQLWSMRVWNNLLG